MAKKKGGGPLTAVAQKHIMVAKPPLVLPMISYGKPKLSVSAKRGKFNPKPGTYFLLKWPQNKKTSWAYNNPNTYRLVYILDVYTLTTSKRSGKTLKQPIRRGLYVQVDFNDNGPRRPEFKERPLTEIRRDITYTTRYSWGDEETPQFIPADLDLTFVVKYGGPNSIVREILDKLRREQEAKLASIQRKVNAVNAGLKQLDTVLKGDKDETK